MDLGRQGVVWLTMLSVIGIRASALQVKDFTFSHLGKVEGMGSQRVFSVVQAPSGAIWWSSAIGVGRYNGSKSLTYSLDAHTPYG